MLLILLACTGPKTDDSGTVNTADVVPPPVNRACLVPADGVAADYTRQSYVIEVFGRISDVGTGAPPGGCRDRGDWVGAETVTWDDANTWWVEIYTAEGDTWYGAATNPWVPDPTPLIKEEVRVSYRSLLPPDLDLEPPETEMTFEAPGYRFYLGVAGVLDDLEPFPELALAPGATEREWEAPCGDRVQRQLDVTDAGGTVAIPTGETHGFDGVGVWAGGIVEDVTDTCSGVTDARASVFEWTIE